MKYLPPSDKNTSRISFDSVEFNRVRYEVKQNHLIIFAQQNGTFSIAISMIDKLIAELKEVSEAYSD